MQNYLKFFSYFLFYGYTIINLVFILSADSVRGLDSPEYSYLILLILLSIFFTIKNNTFQKGVLIIISLFLLFNIIALLFAPRSAGLFFTENIFSDIRDVLSPFLVFLLPMFWLYVFSLSFRSINLIYPLTTSLFMILSGYFTLLSSVGKGLTLYPLLWFAILLLTVPFLGLRYVEYIRTRK